MLGQGSLGRSLLFLLCSELWSLLKGCGIHALWLPSNMNGLYLHEAVERTSHILRIMEYFSTINNWTWGKWNTDTSWEEWDVEAVKGHQYYSLYIFIFLSEGFSMNILRALMAPNLVVLFWKFMETRVKSDEGTGHEQIYPVHMRKNIIV